MKPPKGLRSKYEAKMEAKKQKEIEDKEQKIRDDELKRIAVCFHFTYVFKILLCVSRNWIWICKYLKNNFANSRPTKSIIAPGKWFYLDVPPILSASKLLKRFLKFQLHLQTVTLFCCVDGYLWVSSIIC